MTRLHRPTSLLTRFSSDRSGAIALLFGLLILPLILAVGVFVDFSRGLIARERLNNAIDAAALAIGASAGQDLSDEEITALAQSYFDANYPPAERGWMAPLQVDVDGDTVKIAGTGKVDTILMKLAGFDDMDIAANTEVTRKQNHVELVMALDNTGSMAGNKLRSLKTASKGLLDILFEEEDDSEYVKVGLVPFAAAVNVGADKRNSGWIDPGVAGERSSIHDEDFKSSLPSIFDLYDKMEDEDDDFGWAGCVRARPGDLALNDTAPNSDNPDTLFVPYLAPDEPDDFKDSRDRDVEYANNYLDDKFRKNGKNKTDCGSMAEGECRQRKHDKYNNPNFEGDGAGPSLNCSRRPILPLTNDKDDVEDEIDDMVASGNTVIPEGLAWAWRVISPGEPFTEGVEYDDGKTIKAIVLLTDGDNVAGGGGNHHNQSSYNAFGYAAEGHLGDTDGDEAEEKLDEYTSTLCGNVKAAGIRLYTITFQVSSTRTRDLMRNCATETAMYYNTSSGSDLGDVFADIAKGLNQLRISK